MRRLAEPLLGAGGAKLGLTGKGKRSATVVRASLAGVLLIGGLALLLRGHAGAELLRPLGGLILVVAAIVVLLGPWWLRIARDLVVERQARARAEERADMAARVHDSVLQTLALIQRNARRAAAGHQAGPGPGAGTALLAVRRPGARLGARCGPDPGRRGAAHPAGGRGGATE